MFRKVYNYLKQFLNFWREKPQARLESHWATEASGQVTSSPRNSGNVDTWIPYQLNYYLPNGNHKNNQSRDEDWTPERLITMSESLGQAYAPGLNADELDKN